jgi:hypothetical protein
MGNGETQVKNSEVIVDARHAAVVSHLSSGNAMVVTRKEWEEAQASSSSTHPSEQIPTTPPPLHPEQYATGSKTIPATGPTDSTQPAAASVVKSGNEVGHPIEVAAAQDTQEPKRDGGVVKESSKADVSESDATHVSGKELVGSEVHKSVESALATDLNMAEAKSDLHAAEANDVPDKYLKMLKLGVPRPAVEQKMTSDGIDAGVIAAFHQGQDVPRSGSPKAPPPDATGAEESADSNTERQCVKLCDHPEYAKYFRMLKMGVPKPAVMIKMKAEGLDPAMLDRDPCTIIDAVASDGAAKQVKLSDHPEYAKYFRMLKMGVPKPAVLIKMKAEGLDPTMLDRDPCTMIDSVAGAGDGAVKQVEVCDHPEYAKYFRMLKMGVPKPAVMIKMKAEGLDPTILDEDPSTMVALESASNGEKKGSPMKKASPKKPTVRRKKIHWEALPASRFKNAVNTVWAATSFQNTIRRKSSTDGSLTSAEDSGDESEDNENDMVTCEGTGEKQDGVQPLAHLQVDEAELEALFVEKGKPKTNPNKAQASKDSEQQQSSKSSRKRGVMLLDGRRGQNVGIGLARIKLTNEQVRDALMSMDLKALGDETVKLLHTAQLLPTREEVLQVQGFKGEVDQLAAPEQFFVALAKVPDALDRLETLVYMAGFKEHMEEVARVAEQLKDACRWVRRVMLCLIFLFFFAFVFPFAFCFPFCFLLLFFALRFSHFALDVFELIVMSIYMLCCVGPPHSQVRNSEALKQVLQVVLLIGNRINAESKGGPALGFTVASLLKLSQTKSFNRKTTILDYIVSFIHKQIPTALQFTVSTASTKN